MTPMPPYVLPGLSTGSSQGSSQRIHTTRFAETADPTDARAVAERLQRVLGSAGLRSFYEADLRLWGLLA